MAQASLVVFGVLVPAALRRPWRSKPMLSLLPFAVGAVLAACFVDNLERAMAQGLTAALRRDLLALAGRAAAGSSSRSRSSRSPSRPAITHQLALPHRLSIIAALCVAAAVAELALCRVAGQARPQERSG